jgi:type IV pilus assembly protein PilQ
MRRLSPRAALQHPHLRFLRSGLTALMVLVMMLGVVLAGTGTPARAQPGRTALPDTLVIRDVEFESVPAGVALRSLARLYGINLSVEEGLDLPITVHLSRVTVEELLQHLRLTYPLEIRREEGIWHVRRSQEADRRQDLHLLWQSGRLELEAAQVRLDSLGAALARQGVLTLLSGTLGDRRVSGYVSTASPEEGVRALLRSHGLELLREAPGVYLVREASATAGQPTFELFAEGNLVTFRLAGAPLDQVLRELARVLQWNIFFYGEVKGTVSATAEALPANRALELLLVGTGLGVRIEESSLLVGDARLLEFGEARLIVLNHLKVEGLIERIPENLLQAVALQAIPEQNGLLVSGPTPAINAVESFVAAIDHPVQQILFETLVVDFYDEVGSELGLELGVGAPRDSTHAQSFFPQIDVETRGSYLKGQLSISDKFLNLPVVGELPDDFYIRLRALEKAGRVRVRSRPQLATVNGNPATLTVGTTQYFLIRSETTFAQQTVQTRISEQFETIEANMTLSITPWVTASGEIVTRIKPEFNTPQGSLNSQVPPTINHRIVDTTVQLRDGETIILGGLVQETISDEERRFPILWRIPLLGRLFVSKAKVTTTSELMIYLTPHIYDPRRPQGPPGGIGGTP